MKNEKSIYNSEYTHRSEREYSMTARGRNTKSSLHSTVNIHFSASQENFQSSRKNYFFFTKAPINKLTLKHQVENYQQISLKHSPLVSE